MMQSSIRFSLVGEQVGWTTKMSRARTFCSISTSTSPSEKRPTLALPRPIDRCVAMSCASAGFALPVKRTVLKSTATFERSATISAPIVWQGRKDSNLRMSESKSDALTSLATPLHRCAARAAHLKPGGSRRALDIYASPPGPSRRADGAPGSGTSGPTSPRANRSASLPMAPRRRPPGRRPRCPSPSSGCCRRLDPAAAAARADLGAKSSRPRPADRCARSRRRVPARFPLAPPARRHRRADEASGKARDSSSGGDLGHARVGENVARVAGRRRGLTTANQAGASGTGRSRSPMPVGRRRCAPARKNGTSAPSARPSGSRRSSGQSRPPEPVQREQRRRRVGAAAAQAGAPGHALVDRDVGAQRRCPRPAAGRAPRAGTGRRRAASASAVVAGEAAVAAPLEVERVAPVDQHHQRLEQVHAVGALARRRAGTGSAWPAPGRRRAR